MISISTLTTCEAAGVADSAPSVQCPQLSSWAQDADSTGSGKGHCAKLISGS